MPGRAPSSLGDLVDGQVRLVSERDHLAMLGPQVPERGPDGVGCTDELARIRTTLTFERADRDGLDRDGQAPPRSQPVAAGVDEDSAEPRLEPVRIAQLVEPAPGRDHGIVGRILRLARIEQDDPRHAVGVVERPPVEQRVKRPGATYVRRLGQVHATHDRGQLRTRHVHLTIRPARNVHLRDRELQQPTKRLRLRAPRPRPPTRHPRIHDGPTSWTRAARCTATGSWSGPRRPPSPAAPAPARAPGSQPGRRPSRR